MLINKPFFNLIFRKIEFTHIIKYIIMERNIEWANIKKSQRKILFNKYIIDKLEENENNIEIERIDKLIYSKNKFLLKTLKKDETYYKNIKDEDIIIKNNIINKIKSIETNDEGLIYCLYNKLKQTKITDYKNNRKNNKNEEIKYKNGDYKMDDNGNPVFLIP
jgi:hypothetical protein